MAGIATPHPEGIEDQKYDGKTASASFDVEMFGPWPVIKTDGVYAQLEMYAQLRPGSHLDRRRAQRRGARDGRYRAGGGWMIRTFRM